MLKKSTSKSSRGSSSNNREQPPERMIVYTVMKCPKRPIKVTPIEVPVVKQKIVYDEDDILIDDDDVPLKCPDPPSEDSLDDTEGNHLQRQNEVYPAYLRSLPERFSDTPPQVSALYHVDVARDGALHIVTEGTSECFNDVIKKRLCNRTSFNEKELIQMVYDLLLGLRYLELHQNNIRYKQSNIASEVLYLSPADIGIFPSRKKIHEFKILNYFEKLIQQDKKEYLFTKLFQEDQDVFYYPPELLIQLLQEQNLKDDDEEQSEQTEQSEWDISCGFRGGVWSIGMMLLRCFYSSQGDFLSHLYNPRQKWNYIHDLLSMRQKSFSPILLVEVEMEEVVSPLEPWFTGRMQQTEEYSWNFKQLLSQLLTIDPHMRPSVAELLSSPIFERKEPPIEQTQEPISLGVFLSLLKLGIVTQVTDRFFTDLECVDMVRASLINTTTTLRISLQSIRLAIQAKVNQVCNELRQTEGDLNVEELVRRLQRICRLNNAKKKEIDQDNMSVKSEAVKPTETTPGRMNRLSRALFMTKRSASPVIAKQDTSSSTQSEQTIVTPLTIEICRSMLLKLLSGASDKNFKAFMGGLDIPVEGVVMQGVRRNVWPRALRLENEQAWREVISLSVSVCGWYSMSKYEDFLQIERDITRVHQYDWIGGSYYGRVLMTKSLRAFVCLHQHNCYIQGMDSIILVLLKAFGLDWQLAVLCLQALYKTRLIHSTDEIIQQIKDEDPEDEVLRDDQVFKLAFQRKLQDKLLLYKWIIVFLDPQLYNYLEQMGFNAEMYVVSWFTNFFAMDFQIAQVMKIWDTLFLADDAFEVYLAAAIVEELRETLLLKDSSGIMSSIKNLQGIINIEQCIVQAQQVCELLPRSLTTLNYTTATTHTELQQSEYVSDRPWEAPPLWEVLQQQPCFYINVFELLTMVRETRNLHPSHLIMLDVRASKSYEEVCIGGSVYASIQNNRITSPQLLRYLELKNSLIPEQDNDRIFTRRNSPAHKPIAFIVLVWDYNTQQQEIGRILKYFLHDLQIKRVCLLKGGVQSFLVDGADALKYKNKVVLPPFIKKEMEDLKSL